MIVGSSTSSHLHAPKGREFSRRQTSSFHGDVYTQARSGPEPLPSREQVQRMKAATSAGPVKRFLKGALAGAGLAAAASLAIAGSITPLGAITMLAAGVTGGVIGEVGWENANFENYLTSAHSLDPFRSPLDPIL